MSAAPLTETLPALTLRLLDDPSLSRGDQALPALTPLDAALLALLALDGAQSRHAVAALLWPEVSASKAATNLRQRIFRLKRMAGQEVVSGDRSIALAEGIAHDLQDYADRLAADPQHGRGALLGALGFPDHEALSERLAWHREALNETRRRVLARAAREHAAQGRQAAALACARAWAHHAPLHEEAHQMVMRLLHQGGDRAAAVAAYRHCEQLLLAELGIEPSPATQDLLAQVRQASTPAAPSSPSIPLALLRPPRLVARQEAWQRMTRCAARGQVLVLEGEAGMGKSRLLTDFLGDQPRWCRVTGTPGDSAVPFSLLARLLSQGTARWGRPSEEWVGRELGRLAPEAGTASGDAFALLRLQQAVRAAVLGWRLQGMAGVALDDLHHADASSVELLLAMAESTSPSGLPWLVATRPGIAASPGAAAALAGLPKVTLWPLDLQAVGELVDTLGLDGVRADTWAPALLQRTGGNPLYVLQTLTSAFEASALQGMHAQADWPLPSSLSALLVARLERLSPPARSVARMACVAGADFTLELACQLLQVQPAALADPWLELQAAQVMTEGRFAHDLIRDATGEITPPAVRRLMHAQVAQALAEGGAAPGRVAEHWDAAGKWPQAAQAYEQAAAQARLHGAKQDEVLKLQAATRCYRAVDTEAARVAAFHTECRALELCIANTQLGDDTRLACEALLAAAGTDAQRAQAQVLLAHYWCERYEPALGLAAAQTALDLARAADQPALALLAAQRMGGALSRLGRYDEAVQAMQPLALHLQALATDERLNWLTDFGLTLDYADQRQDALAVFDTVIAEATTAQRWAVAAAALAPKANALAYLGRTADGYAAMEQSLALCRRAGIEGAGLLVDEATSAGNLRDLGRFSEYLQRAEGLPEALRQAGSDFWAANAEHDLATAYAWLGRADLALRALSSQVDALPPVMQAARLATRARLARDYGVGAAGPRPQALLAQALERLDEAQASSRSHIRLSILLMTARDDPPEAGLARAAGLQAEGLRRQNMILAANADCTRMRLLLGSGDTAAACAVADALLQRLGPVGPPAGIYPVELWWLAWQSLQPHEPLRAQTVLAQAAQWLRHTHQAQVPALFQESFLARNPVNAAVLAAARQLTLA